VDRGKVNAAANTMEDLAAIAKQVVIDLRAGKPHPYARVYWLRREMGRVVATMGVGTPEGIKEVNREYGCVYSDRAEQDREENMRQWT
jgi:hypothetical protein